MSFGNAVLMALVVSVSYVTAIGNNNDMHEFDLEIRSSPPQWLQEGMRISAYWLTRKLKLKLIVKQDQ